jgi:hypothetical protein
MPLCYVEFEGQFRVSGPPRNTDQAHPEYHYMHAFEVFDAGTDNLLMSGAR